MARERIEIIDGKEYVVTTLPKDTRLRPSQARKRALWNARTPRQKAAEIARRRKNAKRRRLSARRRDLGRARRAKRTLG